MTEGLYIPVLVDWNVKNGTLVKCKGKWDQIMFTAPIDLIPGDYIAVRKSDGQPMSIYRQENVVWEPVVLEKAE